MGIGRHCNKVSHLRHFAKLHIFWNIIIINESSCSWSTLAWPRNTATAAPASTYRTARTRTWPARPAMRPSTPIWALSRAAGMTWSRWATCSCTSTAAACRGRVWRYVQIALATLYIIDWYTKFSHFQAATKKQKYEKISEKKMSTPVEVLCKVLYHVNFFNHWNCKV